MSDLVESVKTKVWREKSRLNITAIWLTSYWRTPTWV